LKKRRGGVERVIRDWDAGDFARKKGGSKKKKSRCLIQGYLKDSISIERIN
jgi:hypothetical protein